MKILVAPNAFKGSLTAQEAAIRISMGARRAAPHAETICIPLSDGGDGFIDVLAHTLKGRMQHLTVRGPLGNPINARYFLDEDRVQAHIEMAQASGLMRIHAEERDPMLTSTFGTGELMANAVGQGVKHLVIGLGGSATCDGGAGMACALGARFLDSEDNAFEPTGGTLERIMRIDTRRLQDRLAGTVIEVICDVDNPLLGDYGAAHVYAPQKGAAPEQVEALERGLCHLARVVLRDVGKDMRTPSGGGAAGGLGAGLFAFTGARLQPGADVVLDLLGVEQAMENARLVLTGEGSLDVQTLSGKAPARIAAMAMKKGIPCIALVGLLEGEMGLFARAGFVAVHPLCREGVSRQQAMEQAGDRLAAAAEQTVRDQLTESRDNPNR
ncbi:MAG: glycerate kinase [Planctomycetota bacterium]